MEYLEDYRANQYLLVYLGIMSDSSNPKIEMTYNYYANHGFDNTMRDVRDLENEINFINSGRRSSLSISMWYLALEAFVNILCKVTAIITGVNAEEIVNKEIGARVNFLLRTLGYDEMLVKRTGIYNRISDFRKFRNEIFHDRNTGDEVVFSKTNFSHIPNQNNQADIYQALIVFIEVSALFRYAVPGLDLMPNIAIGGEGLLHFDKLDVIYEKFLKPYFEAVLIKRGLKTRLNLDIDDFLSLPPSTLFNPGEILAVSRIQQEEKFSIANVRPTSIGQLMYDELIKGYNLPVGHTSGLNFFHIDWKLLSKFRYPKRR